MKFFKKISHFFFLFVIISIPASTFAQYYIVGQDPASIKWRQINSPYFNIIFPSGYDYKAQEYINLLELSRSSISLPYLHKNKKVKIVLHNRTVVSNAMVSPTPMHADFFEMPDQISYAQTWQRQLTLHEYRHVVQMQKLHQGTTNVLYYLFGDQAIGAILGVFLPMWFIEGDAVFSETIFSESGRGRSPNFTMDLKAQVLDKKIYAYDKALYGSFRNYVPDHYTLGYQLVLNGFAQYGPVLWNSTLNKVARQPLMLFPFTKSIKDITGTGKVNYYKNVLKSLKLQWAIIDSTKKLSLYIIPEKDKYFTNYRFPNPLSDGSIIVEKSGINNVNQFVKINANGTEKILFTPGFDFNESLSANDSLICWNEKTYDPRWTNRTYSVIKIYNYKSKKLNQLTKKSRLFAPSLSNNSLQIVAVDVSESSTYSIKVFDVETGAMLKSFSTPDNLFFMTPRWSNDDQYIVATVLGDKGKSIILINTTTWKYELVLPNSFVDISQPAMKDNYIVYIGTYMGTSDLYMIELSGKEKYKLTNVRFGASDVTLKSDGNKLFFSTYTANGYRIANMALIENNYKKVTLENLKANYLIDKLVPENNFILDKETIPKKQYPEKKYSRTGHIFNIHSWGVTAVDLNNYNFTPGVSILTQNILSTAYGTLGYYYDPNEMTGKTKLSFEYAGWYPKIGISADYGLRRSNYSDTNHILHELKWMETNLTTGFSLPLNFTHSKWATGITPYVGVSQKFLNIVNDASVKFNENSITSLTYSLSGYSQLKRSLRDIYPKWGISLSTIFKNTPFSSSVSTVYGVTSKYFLPGIVAHQGIRIYAAYQYLQNGNYSYGNVISTPRGYTGISLKKMYSIKAEYALPLLYPDIDLQAVAYLKRITAHVFYDYLTGRDSDNNTAFYNSAGVELYSDWKFLSLLPNIRLGVRGTYRFNDKLTNFEFLYGFSF